MSKQKSILNIIINLAIGFAITFIFYFLPAPEPLTHYGMIVIGLFITANYWYATLGLIWPSMLVLIMFALLTQTASSSFITSIFGNTTIWQVVIMMPLCQLIKETGCAQVIAKHLISKKVFSGKPLLFSYIILVACIIIGFLTSAVEAAMLTFALIIGVADALELDKRSRYFISMLVLGFVTTELGFSTFPYRSYLPSMVSSYESISGEALNAPVYLIMTIVFTLVFALLGLLVCRFILRVDMSAVEKVDTTALFKTDADKKISKEGKASLILMGILILGTMYPSFIKSGWLYELLNTTLGTNLFFALIFIVACLIRFKGKPLVDNPERLMKAGNSWSLLFSMGLMMYFAGLMSGEEAGLQAFLQQLFGNWFSNMNSALFLICIIIITTIVTGFFSNMATGIVMMTIAIPLSAEFGLVPAVTGMIILWSSMFGFLTPGANGATPLLFGNEHLDTKNIYKFLLPLMVLFMIMAVIFGLIMNVIL